MTKVSIVIPVYNSCSTIERTIKMSLEQDYPKEDMEVIVVDDGSTDNVKEIVEKYPIEYLRQRRMGPSNARNSGWKKAKGEIICFTDADCIPEKKWVSKLVKRYTSCKIAAVGGSYGIVNEESPIAGCIHQEIICRHSKMSGCVRALGSYNLSVRRKVLEELGGFSEEYTMASGEDNDLSYRILKNGYDLIFAQDIEVSHYHPDKLLKYLRSQFWHGFWRVKLYMDYPERAKGDDYSNMWDYVQPVVSIIIICLIPFSSIFPVSFILLILLFFAFILQLPISLSVVKKTKEMKYLMLIPITFFRAFARGCGMVIGLWKFVIIRTQDCTVRAR